MTQSVFLDVLFMTQHVRDRGLPLLIAAIEHKPELMLALVNAGWGESTCRDDPNTGRKFLAQLCRCPDPEQAALALRSYFKAACSEKVTEQVVGSSAAQTNSSPLMAWLTNPQVSRSVVRALANQAKALGADFDLLFTHSTYSRLDNKCKSGEHSILSVLVCEPNHFFGDSGVLSDDRKQQALDLIGVGKKFDKCTAGHLARMSPETGCPWILFFIDQGLIKPSELVKMTSRIKTEPITKALMASLAAREAIESMFEPPRACP